MFTRKKSLRSHNEKVQTDQEEAQSGRPIETTLLQSLKAITILKYARKGSRNQILGGGFFVGRFSATMTNSRWRNLDFFRKFLEFF